jgi:hypothetical protein
MLGTPPATAPRREWSPPMCCDTATTIRQHIMHNHTLRSMQDNMAARQASPHPQKAWRLWTVKLQGCCCSAHALQGKSESCICIMVVVVLSRLHSELACKTVRG